MSNQAYIFPRHDGGLTVSKQREAVHRAILFAVVDKEDNEALDDQQDTIEKQHKLICRRDDEIKLYREVLKEADEYTNSSLEYTDMYGTMFSDALKKGKEISNGILERGRNNESTN